MAETRVVITAQANQAIQEFERLRASGTASLQQLGAGATQQLGRTTVSAAQTAAALRQVPAQFTDIVVSLQAGQAPLTVLLQQGGQLRDMFGSAGGAARALGGYVVGLVNPFTLAAGAAAALAYAYSEGSKEADAYNKSIIMSGNVAGTTTNQLADMARGIGASVGTQSQASAVLASLVDSGKVSVDNLKSFAHAAVAAQDAGARSAEKMVEDFVALGKAPVDASIKLNEQYHYLTASTYAQIKALQDQGKEDEAAALAQQTWAAAAEKRSADLVASLGTVQRAWKATGDFAKSAWDKFLDLGRKDTDTQIVQKSESRIAELRKQLPVAQDLDRVSPRAGNVKAIQNEITAQQKLIDGAKAKGEAERWNAQVIADSAKLEEAGVKWKQEGVKYLSKEAQLQIELTRQKQLGLDAGESDDAINKRLAKVRQNYSALNNAGMAALEAQRALDHEMLSGNLAALESRHKQGLISDQKYYADKRDMQLQDLDGEAQVIKKQIDLAGGKADLSERAKYVGALAVLQQRRKNLIQDADDSINESSVAATKAVANQANAWTAASASEQQQLQDEVSLFGKTAEARAIAVAQIKVDTEARQLLATWQKQGHVFTAQDIADQNAATEARKGSIAAIMGEQQARAGAEQLRVENQKYAIDSISDDRQRAAARLEVEADVWRQRIALATEGSAAQRALQSQFDTWYANQSARALTEVDLTRATEVLKVMESVDAAARQAASGMEASFGKVGAAIGGLTTALTGYGAAQAAITAQLAADITNSGGNQAKIYRAQSQAASASAQAQVKSYGDMAGAAKGFFKENTAGYKVLQTTEKAYRAYEMALALESMAKKILFKEGEVAANVALNATKVTGEAASTAASTSLAATEASAWGVTAVVKALASLPFPANLAAGAATLAAVIAIGAKVVGSFGGGSGGGMTAADVQKAQGMGSVFGDSSAKSDSVRRSIEMLKTNSDSMLPINQGMLTALQNIESAMTGLTNLVVRTPGLTDGTNMNIKEGTVSKSTGASVAAGAQVGSMIGGYIAGPIGMAIGAVGGAIVGGIKSIWGKTTQSIVDSGLQYGGSVRSLQQGQGFDQYASVDTTKSSWFGLSKSTSNSIQTQGLNDELSKQFGLIFTNLEGSLKAASMAMGGTADDVIKVLDGLTLESTKVSLKGLTGTALTDALNSVISKSMDDIAAAAFPQLDQFRKVGEGYAETVMRIAGDYAKLDSILASSGVTFGATGAASIAARERLIELSGGIDTLASQTASFNQDFLTQAEQLAPVQKYVTDQLAAMGLASVTTRDQFKDTVLNLAKSGALATEAGAQQYAALIALEGAFAKTHAATVDLTKSEQEIADERTDLQNKLDELTMSSAELAAKARGSIDPYNVAIYDQVQAAQAAKDALDAQKVAADALASTNAGYEKQINDLLKANMTAAEVRALETKGMDESTIALYDRLAGLKASASAEQAAAEVIKQAQTSAAAATQTFGNALADSMTKAREAAKAYRALNDTLLVGDSSTLSPEQKYVEAKRQFETADSSKLADAEKVFLDASKAWFGGSAGYAADFAAVLKRNSTEAVGQDALAASIPDFWKSVLASGALDAHENGGTASGWSVVGEKGPEVVNFDQPTRVYTANQSRQMMGGTISMQETNALLRVVLTELRADKTQRGAVADATLNMLSSLANRLDDTKRVLAKATA
jgi:hypothetical protein